MCDHVTWLFPLSHVCVSFAFLTVLSHLISSTGTAQYARSIRLCSGDEDRRLLVVPLYCLGQHLIIRLRFSTQCLATTQLSFPSLHQSPQRTADAVPVRLNPLGQNDVNNRLACVAWLAHLAQAQRKLFSVQFARARRRRV